ncbi:MAG: type II toxin-antitoxin system RelE/ParE family toxin [Proteobacteria bacterium]|nr:type II toxin-antitoxin system RelE/ParE family toxin [Pseudomonadota bacterium]MCH8997728.1 type II toxin-antitoxin system RelE/ParE family toxin [Pseudomonadota bacterium]
MIKSFKSKDTARLFDRLSSRRWRDIAGAARRKLEMLNAAKSLAELRVPPGNRLAALKGDRRGQYSIRINDRWRICFVWRGGDAYDVEIVDYH